MSVTFVVGLRACCVAVALVVASARGAEQNPLIGATRDQVLTRYGEPKSQIVSGNRVIFFYPRERVILRDDIVIEVEPVADAPRRAPSAEPPPSTTPAPVPAGATIAGANPSAQNTPSNTSPASAVQAPGPPAPEPKVEIKLVRPPSPKDARPAPIASPPPSRETVAPKVSSAQTTAQDNAPTSPAPSTTESRGTVPSPAEGTTGSNATPAPKPAETRKAEELAAAAEKKKKAEALRAARRRLQDATMVDPTEDGIPARTYLLALLVVGGGVGYFIWRYRQRQLELAATSVLNTPLGPPVATATTSRGKVFSADQLNKMEWTKFEELVAEYYSKTGVVAMRTKTGPESPVHIKISWKGEPRPFAYVKCVAHPSGLIDAKPVQDFVAALSADDIRRGYVVTTGRFSVQARDVAEERHVTLLSGDIFLEKLNALPPKARFELMEAISAGD